MNKINKKILIIDDDEGFRMILEEKFLKEKFTVFTAGNGDDGLSLADKEKPDLILVDVMMPKMNGIDMAKIIRGYGNNVIIMFLTNLSDMNHISSAMQSSPSDYIVKADTKISEIIDRVKKRLEIE